MSLVRVERLHREFSIGGGKTVYAVDGVDLAIEAGEVVGLIGESGCGKSTLSRLIVRLLEPTSGVVEFDGGDLATLSREELRSARRSFQVVFQEPFESLNPRLSIGQIIEEPLRVQRPTPSRAERRRRVLETLDEVGLSARFLDRRPRELSGGQQQRVGIARALISRPRLIVLDEPTSSLDLTIRGAIFQLLADLRERHGLTYLFISHDIESLRHFCSRTVVMYLGRVVESGPTDEVLERPMHPYTRALLSAALSVDPGQSRRHLPLPGDPPVPTRQAPGCGLVGRCPIETDRCSTVRPALLPVRDDHHVACLLATPDGVPTAVDSTVGGAR